jgi:hypothetical protein
VALTRPGDEPAGEILASAGGLDVASLRDALALTQVVDLGVIERLHRDDAGHFDAASDAWRYWDGDGAVPANCSTCHAGGGLPFFLANGVQIAHAPTQGMQCTTCHVSESDYGLIEVASVRFPSGAELSFGTSGDNQCAVCHQGRASTTTVNARIGAIDDDVVSDRLGFINIHYFSAAASRFGGEAMGGYQYAGKDYVGFWPHDPDVGTCTQCHDPHNQQIDIVNTCSDCHSGVATVADLRDIREFPGDFDGDGDESVGTYYEIYNMVNMLNEAMQAYASDVVGTPIVYSSAAHPYFFIDANANGVADPKRSTAATCTPPGPRACSAPPTTTSTPRRTPAATRTTASTSSSCCTTRSPTSAGTSAAWTARPTRSDRRLDTSKDPAWAALTGGPHSAWRAGQDVPVRPSAEGAMLAT